MNKNTFSLNCPPASEWRDRHSPPPPPPPPFRGFGPETMIGSAAIHVLRRSFAAALLGLTLLLSLAAPNEAHAQQGCQVGTAKHRAGLKFNYHRQDSAGKLTVATATYRALIALGEKTLPAWTGNNISGNAPTIAISATDLSHVLSSEGLNPQEPNGWRIIVNELACVERGLPAITISGGPEVSEGADAQFTVNVSRASGSAMTVNLKVADVAGSDFVASGNEGRQMVSIPANQTSATYPVPIVNDESDEANGYVTVTVVGGGVGDGYTFTPGAQARVWVSDSTAGQVFVSNIRQTSGGSPGNFNFERAQAFTTGSRKSGYTLKSVDILFDVNELDDLFRTSNPRLTATIRNDSGGTPGTTVVGTLNLPRSSPTFDSFHTMTFRAPAKGIQLSPSTTYFLVITPAESGSPGRDAKLRLVGSDAEDAGGFAGFSIGNQSRYYASWNNTWISAQSWRMSVKGEPNPFTDVVQMKNATRAVAEFGNHKDNGGVRFIVEIGDRLSPKGYARTINYTVGGSAERGEGKDYTIDGCSSSTCSVRLPANRHSVPITIYVNDDGLDENDETIILTLQDGSGYTVNRSRIAPDNPLYTYDVSTLTIRDDDTRGLTFHRRWPDVPEGGSQTYTVKLKSQPTEPVEVTIASNNPDVTTNPTSLLFNPTSAVRWDTAQTVTVHAAHDSDAEDDEATLTHTTSGGDYGGANALSIGRPVSVDDDDTADPTTPRLPRISLEGGPDVTEGAAASFTVNADPAPTSSLTVSVEVFEPPGQDFVAASQERVRTVTLNAGATSTTFTVPTVNDGADEDDGYVQAFVNDGTGYTAGQGSAVRVLDNDDPIPGAYFRSASSDAVEHGGTHEVRVELNYPAPSGGLTLRYSLSGTATAGSSNDFTIQNSGTVSIAAGGVSATIPVAINDDSSKENAETVVLTLIGGTGYTVGGPSAHTLTIEDNDSTSASFSTGASSADEDAGTHNVTVQLSQAAPAGGLTINYSVAGTATAGSGNDFTIASSGSLSIAQGSSSAEIAVAINDDSAEEAAETVILTLTGGTGYTLGSPTTHTLTIAENDRPPIFASTLAILGGSPLPEGAGFGTNIQLNRSLRPDEMATLPVIIGGTATRGTDYRLSCVSQESQVFFTCSGLAGNNPTITLNGAFLHDRTSNRATGPLYLEALEDHAAESNETVVLALGVGGRPLTVTITDAPSSATVSFTHNTFSVNESFEFQPVITLSAPMGRDLTIPLIFTDITATSGSDYTPITQAVLEATGQNPQSPVNIAITDDSIYEGDETFTVAIDTANLPTGVTAGATTTATVTIVDNDPAPNSPQLVLSRSSLTVAEGSTGSYALKLATQPTGTVTVNIASNNNDITVSPSPVTFQSTGSSKLWNVAQTITVTAAQDVDATDDSGTLTHTASGGGYGSVTGSVSVTVNDDDNTAQPSASFASATSTAAESAGTRNVRVNLSSAAPSGGLTLNYSVGGTAMAGSGNDFTIQGSGTLSVTAGSNTANIPVAINDDSTEESAETVILTLTGRTGYTLGSPTVHTLTITDNDTPTNACVSPSLLADAKRYAGENRPNSPDHVPRWRRVLAAFGESNDYSNNPMTLAEAQAQADRGLQRWVPVVEALECLARATPSDAPVISIAGADSNNNGIADSIIEGGTALFTLTATPAPTSDLIVSVDVKNFNVGLTNDETRTRTVTIGTSGTGMLKIVTIDDSKNCPTGTVYVSIQPDVGYRVAAEPDDADSVSVTDSTDSGPCTPSGVSSTVPPLGLSGEIEFADPAPRSLPGLDPWDLERTAGAPAGFTPDLSAGACVSSGLLSDAAGYANENWRGPAHVERWLRVMQTFSGSASDATIVTPAEAQHYAIGGAEAWLPVAGALRCLEAQSLGGALYR